MIRSFRCKETEKLFGRVFSRKLPPGVQRVARRKLEILDAAETLFAREGFGGDEIISLARDTPNSLIAMSSHGRSGPGRWLLGSVAENVARHAVRPVLVYRPS